MHELLGPLEGRVNNTRGGRGRDYIECRERLCRIRIAIIRLVLAASRDERAKFRWDAIKIRSLERTRSVARQHLPENLSEGVYIGGWPNAFRVIELLGRHVGQGPH